MKSNVSPMAIAGAVIALLLVVFLIYHFTFSSSNNQPAITADNRPDYVKKMQAGQNPGYYGGTVGNNGATPNASGTQGGSGQ